jgi:putative peptidoglycan lipid II flippase
MVWLTFGLAPGFAAEPEKFDLAVLLSRIAFPYLFLVSIVALLSGMLQSVGRFAAAALSPVLLNRYHDRGAAGRLADRNGGDERHSPASGSPSAVTVAGILQLAVLWYVCERAGLKIQA